ncbi:MAG: hypothetical protein HYW24_02640 [Candidatus Aenigmarchaeota archaeon]|nr:hypothetical protein [Candidatus Aenigmarchaeota archaeon]
MPADKDEYELIPLTPLRRLEKRMEKVESTAPGIDVSEFFRELISIIKMNQEIVDQLAKSSDALRIELAKLPAKLDSVIMNLNELIDYIKEGSEEGPRAVAVDSKPMSDKIEQLIETNKKIIETNENVLTLMESLEKRYKPLPPRPPILRPLTR